MSPFGIALDATHVYWTNREDGTVRRMPKAGGATELLATGAALGVAVRDGFVYWTGSSHSLHRTPIAGGASQLLGSLTPTAFQVTSFVSLTSRYAVWGGGTRLGYVDLDGANIHNVSLPCNGCGASGLTADETHIYWTTTVGVVRSAFPSTASEQVATSGGLGIVVDATNAYWGLSGMVLRAPRAGTTSATLADGAGYAEHLALDATHVYWSEGGRTALVRRAPLAGGAPVVVASASVGRPSRIAVDATHVYWADPMGGTIGRAPKAP